MIGRRLRLDDAQLGAHAVDEEIEPDEAGAGGSGHGEGAAPVVQQHLDPDRDAGTLHDLAGHPGHRGDDLGAADQGVRLVEVVLHQHAVDAAGLERLEIGQRRVDEGVDGGEGRIARQRRQRNHADERPPAGEDVAKPAHRWPPVAIAPR